MERKTPLSEKITQRELVVGILIIPMMFLFVAVGIDKFWFNDHTFVDGLRYSPMVAGWMVVPLSWAVPIMLQLLAVALLAGFWWPHRMRAAIAAYAAAMLAFTVYTLLIVTVYKDRQPCECLGIYERLRLTWLQQFWLNVGILTYVLVVWTIHDFGTIRRYLLQRMERKPEAPKRKMANN